MMKEKWIWASNDDVAKDSYAEFIGNFKANPTAVKWTCKLLATVYIT